MKRRTDVTWVRQAGLGVLGLVMLFASVVVPVLDVDEAPDAATVEAEHSADSCPSIHDHALCVQWSENRLAVSPASPGLPPALPRLFAPAPERHGALALPAASVTRSRGPPAFS